MSKDFDNLVIEATVRVSRRKIDDLARSFLGAHKLDSRWDKDLPLAMRHLLVGDEVEYMEPSIYAVYNTKFDDALRITFRAKQTTTIDRFNTIIRMIGAKIGS